MAGGGEVDAAFFIPDAIIGVEDSAAILGMGDGTERLAMPIDDDQLIAQVAEDDDLRFAIVCKGCRPASVFVKKTSGLPTAFFITLLRVISV